MWFIHTTKYFSALKRHEVLTHAATWINLICEISRSQKDSLFEVPILVKFMETEDTSQGRREEKLGINVEWV